MEHMERFARVLGKNPLFAGMEQEETEKAIALLKGCVCTYRKGSFLHPAGERLERFGFVLTGAVQACRDDISGNRMIMAEVLPGVTFGESLCYLQVEDSPVYIYASQEAQVLWLSLQALFTGSTDPLTLTMQMRFTALLAKRTLAMHDRILILSKLSIREKLLVYFDHLAKTSGKNSFTVPLNREDMATYIGANRASLCRELSKMKQEGLIEYRGSSFRLLHL